MWASVFYDKSIVAPSAVGVTVPATTGAMVLTL